MKLREWVNQKQERTGRTRKEILGDLAEAAGVSLHTLLAADRGQLLGQYSKAQAVEKATRGQVTIKELCE